MEPERDTNIAGSQRERTWLYIGLGALVGGLMVWAVIAFHDEKESDEANAMADKLIEKLEDEGFTAPDQDVLVSLLGTDGGKVCEFAGDDLNEAEMKQRLYNNGAGGPGARPGPVDGRLLEGAILVSEVYCPDETEDLEDLKDDFEFYDVIRG